MSKLSRLSQRIEDARDDALDLDEMRLLLEEVCNAAVTNPFNTYKGPRGESYSQIEIQTSLFLKLLDWCGYDDSE